MKLSSPVIESEKKIIIEVLMGVRKLHFCFLYGVSWAIKSTPLQHKSTMMQSSIMDYYDNVNP